MTLPSTPSRHLPPDSRVPILRMCRIAKSFGATQALRDVSLEVYAGRVLALIGENGAGKSTLMKVLSGAHRPDSGSMEFEGREFLPKGPHHARMAGVAMIYQELNLAPDLTVEENIMLGQDGTRFGWLRRTSERASVRDALGLLGHADLNPRTAVKRLSVGEQQLVEIARALVGNARVLVFDEPTSSLPHHDVNRLFQVIEKLRGEGLGIVYISHFLEEVRRIGDDYHVLRDGETVATGQLDAVNDETIVAQMVGRTVEQLFPRVPHTIGPPLLRLRGVSGQTAPKSVDLELRRGEILGMAGLVGAGRTELLRCLFGLDPRRSGLMELNGQRIGGSPAACTRAGLGLVSEDRKNEGLAQQLSIADNTTLNYLRPYEWIGWLRLGHRRQAVRGWMEQLGIKAPHPDCHVETLSGGNQQKVAIARVLHQRADLLLLDEPTRGIDLGTKTEIYRLVGELAAAGKAIVFVSSYLPELLAVCDRVGVMSRGKLVDVREADQWTEEEILSRAIAGSTYAS